MPHNSRINGKGHTPDKAVSIYTAIMGHISSDLVAANSIVTVVRNFGAVFCYAVAGSTGIYIGKDLGAGKLKEAEEDSRRALILVMITGILGGFIIFLITPLVLQLTDLSSQASLYLKSMLYINCIYIMGGALNGTLINGIFRAGGDSRFGLICDIIDMWVYAVPLGLFAAFVWKLPPLLVYLLLCTDEFVKLPWVWKHYQSKRNFSSRKIGKARLRKISGNIFQPFFTLIMPPH